jgi:hypothetical protein
MALAFTPLVFHVASILGLAAALVRLLCPLANTSRLAFLHESDRTDDSTWNLNDGSAQLVGPHAYWWLRLGPVKLRSTLETYSAVLGHLGHIAERSPCRVS